MSYLAYKWKLWKLKQNRAKQQKEYALKFTELRKDKSKDSNDYGALQADEYSDHTSLEEAINACKGDRLVEQAIECDVEIPTINDKFWQYTDGSERYYLNKAGRDLLRDQILQAKTLSSADLERRSRILAPVISAIAGLIGVIIGLIAILQHKK